MLAATTASFSQHTPFVLTPDLEVTDSGTITREQWRDILAKRFETLPDYRILMKSEPLPALPPI